MTKSEKKTTRRRRWDIAVGLLVAFLVGGVIGAVVERERVLNARDETPAASGQTLGDWFTSGDTAVCAPLRRWSASTTASYTAFLQGAADWGASRATLLEQSSEGTAALRSLLPLVSPTGKAEIQSLVDRQAKVHAALTSATSVAEYSASSKTLDSERTRRDIAILSQAVQYCPAG